MHKLGCVEQTGQFRLTWAVQGDSDCFKLKGRTDEQLLEGRRVSDESKQCLELFGEGLSLAVESHACADQQRVGQEPRVTGCSVGGRVAAFFSSNVTTTSIMMTKIVNLTLKLLVTFYRYRDWYIYQLSSLVKCSLQDN